eukprot:gnl/TRDRNA2_/TRDRNA2_36812_c0_seq1.p1 gnl/TRDRNA2_/TRDRNA2_36812_c0~~gnl/TRDRNA2_/TRDRNA2_36812_c0_seq1.p1  ORF type:complete len:312 (+),score=61.71 gnl/TRDRNA2_/TRDRNA2_36812_c0_seq1:53-988(+)
MLCLSVRMRAQLFIFGAALIGGAASHETYPCSSSEADTCTSSESADDELSLLQTRRLHEEHEIVPHNVSDGTIADLSAMFKSALPSKDLDEFVQSLKASQAKDTPTTAQAQHQALTAAQEMEFAFHETAAIQISNSSDIFPEKAAGRTKLAEAPLVYTLLGVNYHPYDVGVYLKDDSRLWGQPSIDLQNVANNVEAIAVVFKTTEKIPMPLETVKQELKNVIMPFIQIAHATEADADTFLQLQFGERSPIGTFLTITCDNSGGQIYVAHNFKGRVNSYKFFQAMVYYVASTTGPLNALGNSAVLRLRKGLH